MATVYKRGRDENERHACWWISYRDKKGRRRTVKGYSDKRATESLAAKLEDDARKRRDGLIDSDEEELLAKRRKPVSEHLAAFEQSLTDNTPKHVQLVMTRVRRIINGCGFATLAQLNAEFAENWLRQFAKEEDLGNRTYNHYLQALYEFGAWLLQTRRLPVNPFDGIKRRNAEVDIRHRRRALTTGDVEKLVNAARESQEMIQCFDGETRARIYIISFFTALRRNEIASLTPRSFDLRSDPPTVTVQAAFSKHRRLDVLPLHPDLVAMLREWLVGLDLDTVIFPKLGRRRTWLMVKKDLERAGIPYETPEGIADFHACGRHSHVTEVLRSGASLPEARELARHSDIRMTMKYTHVGIRDQADAVSKLPWQRIGSASRHLSCPDGSSNDSKSPANETASENISDCDDGTSDSNKLLLAASGLDDVVAGRAGSIPAASTL
jgi:site-specific recombinase XerC